MATPALAFVPETVPTPRIGPREVLVAVMAAGVNYNNVWLPAATRSTRSARARSAASPRTSTSAARDASGIVYAIGSDVTGWAIGDEVTIHPGVWDEDDPWIAAGKDQMIAPSARIWGYDTNYGSFGQFARVQSHQLMPKAEHLSWAEAAAPTLVGTTAYRMLLAGRATPFRRVTWSSFGAAPAASAPRPASSSRPPGDAPSPSSPATIAVSTP